MPGKAINKNDARYLSTQSLLEDTMLQLIRKEGFQKITVCQIVSEAGLNRGTFYLHAVDKYDLLGQIEDGIYEEMMSGISELREQPSESNPLTMRAIMLKSVNYISENKDTIMLLMSEDCDPLFFDKYVKKIKTQLFPDIADITVEEQYTISLMGSIVGGFFNEWIRRGMKESPEEYVNIIMNITAKTNLIALSSVLA